MLDVPLTIGARDRPATGGAVFERRNPVAREVATHAAAVAPPPA